MFIAVCGGHNNHLSRQYLLIITTACSQANNPGHKRSENRPHYRYKHNHTGKAVLIYIGFMAFFKSLYKYSFVMFMLYIGSVPTDYSH